MTSNMRKNPRKPDVYCVELTEPQVRELAIALGHHRALAAAPKPSLNYPGAVEVIDSILPTLNTILESCNR